VEAIRIYLTTFGNGRFTLVLAVFPLCVGFPLFFLLSLALGKRVPVSSHGRPRCAVFRAN
jgi:hypothetical protein